MGHKQWNFSFIFVNVIFILYIFKYIFYVHYCQLSSLGRSSNHPSIFHILLQILMNSAILLKVFFTFYISGKYSFRCRSKQHFSLFVAHFRQTLRLGIFQWEVTYTVMKVGGDVLTNESLNHSFNQIVEQHWFVQERNSLCCTGMHLILLCLEIFFIGGGKNMQSIWQYFV